MNKRESIKLKSQLRKNMKKYDIRAEKDMRAVFEPDTYYPPHFRWNQWYKCCWLYRWRDIVLDIDADVDVWKEGVKQLKRH